jgi:ribosomal protein L37E
MFKQLCPKCGRNSYSAAEESYLPCPYCGFRFSGTSGPDRRHEERIAKEDDVVLAFQGRRLEAKSIDFSTEGMAIKIFGQFLGRIGDTIDISREDSQIHTKVAWINQLSDRSIVGLRRLN